MRIRIQEKTEILGKWYNPGDIVEVPDGFVGPHRANRITHDRIDYSIDPAIDANRIPGKLEDVPLFDEVDADGKVIEKPKQGEAS